VALEPVALVAVVVDNHFSSLFDKTNFIYFIFLSQTVSEHSRFSLKSHMSKKKEKKTEDDDTYNSNYHTDP